MNGLSFDISRKRTGIAYWEGGEAVKLGVIGLPDGELGMQLHLWDGAIEALLDSYQPDYLCFEDARGVNKQHAEVLFGATGILKLHAYRRDIQIVGFAQATVKKALSGKGNATKPMMLAAAQERWPALNVTNDDEADALGVGVAFINLVGVEALR